MRKLLLAATAFTSIVIGFAGVSGQRASANPEGLYIPPQSMYYVGNSFTYCNQYSTLTACLAATPSGGTAILAPNTTYNIASVLTLGTANTTLLCPSKGTILQRNAAFTTNIMIAITAANVTIDGCTIDSNNTTGSFNTAIQIQADHDTVKNSKLINFTHIGIAVATSGTNADISKNQITGTGVSGTNDGYGVWSLAGASGLSILDNTFTNNVLNGVIVGGPNLLVSRNRFINNHTYTVGGGGQILIATGPSTNGVAGPNAIVSDNWLSTSISGGIELSGLPNGTHGTASGTTAFSDTTCNCFNSNMVNQPLVIVSGAGFTVRTYNVAAFTDTGHITLDVSPGTGTVANWYVGNAPNIVVKGNTIEHNNGSGIGFDPSTAPTPMHAQITENIIHNEVGVGIFDGGNTTNYSIVNNRIYDDQETTTMTQAINIQSGASDFYEIRNNRVTTGTLNSIVDNGTGINKDVRQNQGVDNTTTTISSAATLVVGLNPVQIISGTTGVTALSGKLWANRIVTFISTGGAVAFTAGGNIGNTFTSTQNVPFQMLCNATATTCYFK